MQLATISEQYSIAVIIPCYNEAMTIVAVINAIKQHLATAQIYVVDNNSSDNTAQLAIANGATVIHERRQGKAYAIRTAFKLVVADIYLMVDGDNTYPINEAMALLLPIVQQ